MARVPVPTTGVRVTEQLADVEPVGIANGDAHGVCDSIANGDANTEQDGFCQRVANADAVRDADAEQDGLFDWFADGDVVSNANTFAHGVPVCDVQRVTFCDDVV